MFWRISESGPNCTLAAKLLLELINVKLSHTTLQQEVEDHPDYPSLLSISDVFRKYKVDNITANFAPTDLVKIPPPFITQLRGTQTDTMYFTVVKQCTGTEVMAFDPERKKWRTYRFEEFAGRSSAVVLLAEPGEGAGEPGFEEKRRDERQERVGQFTLMSLVAAVLVATNINAFLEAGLAVLAPALFSLLSAIGILTGILLILFELDKYNPVVRQLCKGGKHVNCNAILQSNASRIWGINWSSIGLSYFSAQMMFLLIGGISTPGTFAVAGIASLLAFPYVLYSVHFQWRVARQWCVLCLIVQCVLVLQAAIAGWHLPSLAGQASLPKALLLMILSAITLLAVLQLVPMLKKVKRNDFFKNQLKRLKYDPDVFKTVLHNQRNLHEGAAGLGIVLGNPNATNRILKVCNPYCGPCAGAHLPIEELLESNPDLQLQIIFTATDDDEDRRKFPVRHLMAIAAENDGERTRQALGDWYLSPVKDYESFAGRYPIEDRLAQQDLKIKAMHDWCIKTGIAHTPTIFINNYELPDIYDVHDLKNFLSV
ncbi:vitamin K epoxide reductase family protein [Chitinophaga caseinilytica]|uniref:vitamin K epoxide reductase family protein n=1 Tax=Chitinophaga caseinilytica TaxID=2267521 RepID=UPI003C306AF6